jgi:cysteinyl-tRNA synthetase
MQKRQLARDKKDWSTSDALREQMKQHGIGINDSPLGQIWYRL